MLSTVPSSQLPSEKKHCHTRINLSKSLEHKTSHEEETEIIEETFILEHSSKMSSNRQKLQQGKAIQYKGKKL